MNQRPRRPKKNRNFVDLHALKQRSDRGEQVDVLEVFTEVAGSPVYGAERFVETFRRFVGKSSDIDEFKWRITEATKPEHINRIRNTIPVDSAKEDWVFGYSKRLAVQLGTFATRNADEAGSAGLIWGERMIQLTRSDLVDPIVRADMEKYSKEVLAETMEPEKGPAAVGALIAYRAFEVS